MGFPDDCAFVWRKTNTGFLGRVSPDACEFDSRAFDQPVRPDMSYEIDASGLTWTETLRDDGGDELASTSGALRARRVGPVIDSRRTYYEVQGATVSEVRRDLHANASVEDEGELRFARADWQISLQTDTEELESGCRIGNVSTTVAVAYLLPRWSGRDEAAPALRDEWDGFIGALLGHLLRHQRLAVDTANRIEMKVGELGERPSCDALVAAADEIAARVIENARRRERQYDYTSRFGKTEGADFPIPSDE
jgi:predicted secreted Zn-dependent protease